MKQVRQDLMLDGREDMASRVMSYRSGYSAQVRRRHISWYRSHNN
jgi:DEAD/DEAH box helicase domain-containing protein